MFARVLLTLLVGSMLPAPAAFGQGAGGAKVSAREMAMIWLTGRYVSPATCTRPDGTLFEVQEAITVRAAPERGDNVLKATFFGIPVTDVTHCQNTALGRLRDRRGVLYFTFRASWRSDMGVRDFRQTVETGDVTYHVQGGRLQVRAIGEDGAEPDVYEYDGADAKLRLLDVLPRSDGDRMLATFAKTQGALGPQSRRFEMRLDPDEDNPLPDGAGFRTFMIEDLQADSRGLRRKRN